MKYLIPILFMFLISFPVVAQAVSILPFTDPCDDPALSGYTYSKKLCELLTTIMDLIWLVGIGIAVIMIIVSGISYMTAGGDETKIAKAKKMLTNGIIGVAIVFAAGFIVGLIRELILSQVLSV